MGDKVGGKIGERKRESERRGLLDGEGGKTGLSAEFQSVYAFAGRSRGRNKKMTMGWN